jgi:hypothetical protein
MLNVYPGVLRCIACFFCHALDLICFIGFLAPLYDRKNQTFADKICHTLVGLVPPVPELEKAALGYERDSLTRG